MLWCAEGKSFYATVTSVISNGRCEGSLEAELQKMRPTFMGLMRNPPRNAQSRENLKRSSTDGIMLAESAKPVVLQQVFIEESLLLSDLFDLEEIKAAELLLAGEQQQANFPGLPRGLCAVLVYYDNRRFIAQTLKALIQSRSGRFWDSTLDSQFAPVVQQFLRQLWSDGLLAKLLEFLKNWRVEDEMKKLREKKGLGVGRHQKLVKSLIVEVDSVLGDAVLYWAAQTPLPLLDMTTILRYLQSLPVSQDEKTAVALRKSDLSLISAVLYCLDSAVADEIEENSGEELLKAVPLVKDRNVAALWQEITNANWSIPALQGVFQLATAIFIRSLSHFDFAHEIMDRLSEDEEIMLDKSLDKSTLVFIRNSIVAMEDFHSEELSIRRFHSLITGLIMHFQLKVKELRTQTDEEIRFEEQREQTGMGPPLTARLQFNFEQLLLLIGDIYKTDPLGLELSKEFWSTDETDGHDSQTSFATANRHQAMLTRFLRSNAEFLPSRLYVAYLDMLDSLSGNSQSAAQCFHFLNSNSSSGGSLSALSWSQLFNSLNRYYQTLKTEYVTAQTAQSIPTIAPTELKALMSWLKVTQKVCENNEKCLLAFCERPEWSAMEILFGLVGCPIPLELKGEIFQTLAVFASNDQLALSFWVALHNCGALPILPEEKLGGVQVELDEVETRAESYPVCRGFLRLLAALWGRSEQGESRPYLDYLVGSVLIRFKSRSYKNGVEMWQVAAAAMECLYNTLHNCELKKSSTVVTETAFTSAGCQALIHLLTEPPVIRNVFLILEDAIQLLDMFKDLSGNEFVEKASLMSLKVIHEALTLEPILFDCIRQSGTAVMAASLECLLQTVNPRSGEVDYILTIARFATQSLWLPEHALYTVKILQILSDSPVNHPKIVRLITSKPELRDSIRIGMVDCFDVESDLEAHRSLSQKPIDSSLSVGEIRGLCALSLLQLLNASVNKPMPNFAHFLLGFDMRDPARTKFENPGTNGFSKTCLHVIVSLLDSNLNFNLNEHSFSGLVEPSWKLLYQLASSQLLSESILRYLRNSHDFLYRHIAKMVGLTAGQDNEVELMEEQSWLLKLCGLELRCLAVAKQKSQVSRFVKLLFEESDKPTTGHQNLPLRIVTFIDGLSLAESRVEEPSVEYFDAAKLKEVISLCTRQTDGYPQIDVQLLRSLLQGELASLQGTSIGGQTLLIHKEIQNILRHGVQFNLVQRASRAKVEMMIGWKQLISTALIQFPVISDGYDSTQERLQKLADVLLELLRNVTKQTRPDFLPEALFSSANVILMIIVTLRQIVMAEIKDWQTQDGFEREISQQYVSLLDRTESEPWRKSLALWKVSGLGAALKLLIDLLLKHEIRLTKTKVLLYGGFLSFSKLVTAAEPQDTADQSYMEMSHVTIVTDDCVQDFVKILNSRSSGLAELFCKDAYGGNEILKTVALCCLNFLVGFGNRADLSAKLAAGGHLQNFTDSLESDDGKLQVVLTRSTESLRPLYVFTSKMAFLSALATNPAGANLLLQHNTVARLSQCRFFSLLPDSLFSQTNEDPNSLAGRYTTALQSSLSFCLAVVNGVGPANREANVQILQLCSAHMEVFSFILQSASKMSSRSHLKLVELVTAVISYAATEGNLIDLGAIDLQGTSQHLLRATMRIFAPFAEFPVKILGATSALQFQFGSENVGFEKSDETQMTAELSCIRILNSLLSYGGRIVAESGTTAKQGRPIFAPSFSTKESTSGGDVSPSLYHLVQTLRTAVSHYNLVVDKYTTTAKSKAADKSDVGANTKKRENLKRNCVDQLDALYLTVELTLVLLWRHLNFYFSVAVEDSPAGSYQSPVGSSRVSAMRTPMRKLQESSPRSPTSIQTESAGVSKSVVDQLRIDMLSALDDGMINRLKKLNQMASKLDPRKTSEVFNEAVVRHIQRLIKLKN